MHNNESRECPECGKVLKIYNLKNHMKSVHQKIKKTDICNEEPTTIPLEEKNKIDRTHTVEVPKKLKVDVPF